MLHRYNISRIDTTEARRRQVIQKYIINETKSLKVSCQFSWCHEKTTERCWPKTL